MSDRGVAADGDANGEESGVQSGVSPAADRGERVSGRPYLLGAAVTVTLFAAAAGYVVAANNAVETVTVFGAVVLPGSPAAMAAYGGGLSLLVLGTLFGLVAVASRVDDGAV